MINAEFLQKWYTRVIGIFFVFVLVSLINEIMMQGNTPDLWHKAFHVLLGTIVLHFGWDNEKFWKPFCFANGAFFLYVGIFGWIFPSFAGLSAFGLMDTALHTIVGISGLVCGFWNGSVPQANASA